MYPMHRWMDRYDILQKYQPLNLLFPLITSPYLHQNSQGIGIIATLTNPSRLVAHATPSLSYIWKVKSGKAAPRVYLARPLAAIAEAPLSGP